MFEVRVSYFSEGQATLDEIDVESTGGAGLQFGQCATIWITSFMPQASAYLRRVFKDGE